MSVPLTGDIQHASGPDRIAALQLLFTGSCLGMSDDSNAGGGVLGYAQEHGLDLTHLWVAKDQKGVLVSALLIPCAGRTGMIFVSPLTNRYQKSIAPRVIDRLCRHVPLKQVTLAQALLDPHQDDLANVLAQSGFSELATLLYLSCPSPPSPPIPLSSHGDHGLHWPSGPQGVRLLTFNDARRTLFEQTILNSYEQSLDCPGLKGLRTIDDILQGHLSTGTFLPERWFLAIDPQQQPAGVMLLNELPEKNELELVYLGLVPAFRGRGLGQALLNHGLRLVLKQGFSAMTCACDEKNAPALAMYRRLGFVSSGKKRAWLRSLASG